MAPKMYTAGEAELLKVMLNVFLNMTALVAPALYIPALDQTLGIKDLKESQSITHPTRTDSYIFIHSHIERMCRCQGDEYFRWWLVDQPMTYTLTSAQSATSA